MVYYQCLAPSDHVLAVTSNSTNLLPQDMHLVRLYKNIPNPPLVRIRSYGIRSAGTFVYSRGMKACVAIAILRSHSGTNEKLTGGNSILYALLVAMFIYIRSRVPIFGHGIPCVMMTVFPLPIIYNCWQQVGTHFSLQKDLGSNQSSGSR